jgi:hypothetical protein
VPYQKRKGISSFNNYILLYSGVRKEITAKEGLGILIYRALQKEY